MIEVLRLDPDPTSVGVARAFVARHLEELDVDQAAVLAAQLCASELVTNGVLHANTPLTVRLEADRSAVRIEVADGSPLPPEPHHRPPPDELGGRGLLIVNNMATQWGVDLRPNGKAVWCELPTDPSG